jgi:hypothetical protein
MYSEQKCLTLPRFEERHFISTYETIFTGKRDSGPISAVKTENKFFCLSELAHIRFYVKGIAFLV